jgi:hypothetical protein
MDDIEAAECNRSFRETMDRVRNNDANETTLEANYYHWPVGNSTVVSLEKHSRTIQLSQRCFST